MKNKLRLKKQLILLLLFQSLNTVLIAQSEDVLNQSIPPSPDVASLGKYIDTPVSLSSGIPNITVPIYTIKEGSISVPVNLSYHAGGIRVEEVASRIGLGWSLLTGGLVSRTVRGLPDDYHNGYCNDEISIEQLKQYNDDASSIFTNEMLEILNGQADGEADVFHFNFLGYSGKLYFKDDGSGFVQVPYSNIQIQPQYDEQIIVGWIFTTPDGMKYYFGKSYLGEEYNAVDYNSISFIITKKEGVETHPDNSVSIPEHIASWHLTEIVSPNGDYVKFRYQQEKGVTQWNKIEESELELPCNLAYNRKYVFSQVFSDNNYLDQILFSNGKIKFNLSSEYRKDLLGSKALDSICLYRGDQIWKTYSLEHDYFISSDESVRWATVGDKEYRKYRLKLNSFKEKGTGADQDKIYRFYYNETILPSRWSNAQDYWGFYNGLENNMSLLPFVETFNESGNLTIGEADRSANANSAQACILNKIVYPTGGSSEYFYELNNVLQKNIESKGKLEISNRLVLTPETFTKIPAYYNNTFGDMWEKEVEINANVGLIKMKAFESGNSLNGHAGLHGDFLLQITGITDPSYQWIINTEEADLNLPIGKYRLSAMPNYEGSGEDANFNVTLFIYSDPLYNEEYPELSEIKMGGLRVKKIKLNDSKGNEIEKTYEYTKFNTSLSSGYSIAPPVYLLPNYEVACNYMETSTGDIIRNTSYMHKLSSSSVFPLINLNGRSVMYKEVTEYVNGEQKREYTFSYANKINYHKQGQQVFTPDIDCNWLNGKLLQKLDYKRIDENYIPVRKDEYKYESYDRNFYPSGVSTLQMMGFNGDYYHSFYYVMSEWYRLTTKSTVDYFANDSLCTTIFTYYNNNELLPSHQVSSNSKGKTRTNYYYYPQDYAEVDNFSILHTKNIITKPIDIRTIVDGELIEGKQFKYNDNGEIIKNYQYYQEEANINFSRTEPYTFTLKENLLYTNQGKPKQAAKVEGDTICLIWGYNNQYPVAKVINASYYEIENLPDFGENFDLGEGGLSNEQVNNLRALLPDAMVSTYTYEPLIGLTSETDPNGITTIYQYDSFGRLLMIKDNKGNVLRYYKYHYQE